MKAQIFVATLALASVAGAQDVTPRPIDDRIAWQIWEPRPGAAPTFALKNDPDHVFRETGPRSPGDVSKWVKDLQTASLYGVPTLGGSGPYVANGRVGLIIDRVDDEAGDPLATGDKELSQRFKNYGNPQVTLADLRAIEQGMQSARDHGVPISVGTLEIDGSGHVRALTVEHLQPSDAHPSSSSGGEGLPVPPDPRKAKTDLAHEEKVIASIRAEVRKVQVASETLQQAVERDPKKADAFASRMLGALADHLAVPQRSLSADEEKAVSELAKELHPSTWVPGAETGDEAQIREGFAYALAERLARVDHGRLVFDYESKVVEDGKDETNSFCIYEDGTVRFGSWGNKKRRDGFLFFTPTTDEASRISAAVNKLRDLPRPTDAEKALETGPKSFTYMFRDADGQDQVRTVNAAYLSANPSLAAFAKEMGGIANEVTPSQGIAKSLDRVR
jgi:hypothetical protein